MTNNPYDPQQEPAHQPDLQAGSAPMERPAVTQSRRWLLLPLLIALLAGIFGQSIFASTDTATMSQDDVWIGLGFFAVAIVALFIAVVDLNTRETNHHDFWERLHRIVSLPPWRTVLMLLALAQTALLLVLLGGQSPTQSYNWTVLFWVGAMVSYVVALLPPDTGDATDAGLSSNNTYGVTERPDQWHTSLLVVAIMGVAFGLRFWALAAIPPTLGGDEGSQGLEAMRVLNGEIRNPFTTGWLGVPTMSFYFNATTIALFGNTIFALRLPWVLVGTATVLITFLLVRRLKGLTLGLMTAALLATYHYHIHFSRLGSNQIADTFFVTLALLFFYRGYDHAGPQHWQAYPSWALCGIVVGVAQYFYAGARFTPVLIVALLIYYAVRDGSHFWRDRSQEILVLVGAALIAAAPMIQYAIRFPTDYNARINQVGIIQSGWLEREQEKQGHGPLPILLDQAQRAGLAFNLYKDRTFWYGLKKPLFDFAAAVLFLLGLGYATLNMLDRRVAPMVAWWWGAMLMGGALTENPPSSMRLITLSVPAVFFVALALLRIVHVLHYALATRWSARLVQPVLVAAVVLLSLSSIRGYFVDYTPQRIYGNPNAVVATALGTYARDYLGPEWRIYFFGAPRMYVGFGSITYLAPEVEGVDIHVPYQAPPARSQIPADKHALFVFLPERRAELELVRATFPDGTISEMPSPLGAEAGSLFTMYFVQRSQLGG